MIAASAVAGLVLTGASAVAAPSETASSVVGAQSAAADPCGYWETFSTAWYTHCGDSCIWIVVDYEDSPNQYKQVRQRGTVDLGGAADVNNAWYSHPC
ncbi:DUF6355 family natural product biosynthesis protein [Amycolatopsis sp. lyj-112]|uniref:DUF6355 family natural product biosynthesis protein n=1 Tax=Amycolatopsis sp. lyj-112 TaxID=2789288 RepID=UPI00397D1FA4